MLRKILLPLVLLQLASALYAKDEIWIDFGVLPSGYAPEDGTYIRQYDPAPIQEGDETVVDYSNVYDPFTRAPQNLLPSRFANQTADSGNPAYDEMKLSLALDRWQVKLSSSSTNLSTKKSSEVVAYNVKDSSSRFAGEQIMAVHFSLPNLLVNSKAWVSPEFAIPAYSVDLSGVAKEDVNAKLQEDVRRPASERMGQFLNKGVLRNVGPIRSITVTVYGRRFPMNLFVEADHTDVGRRSYPFGSLEFSGWQDLVWTNSNYIVDVRKRKYNTSPEYPRGMPSMILRSLRLDRPIRAANESSSEVVFYIKQISVTYDNATPETFDTEIDDEHIWQLNTVDSQRHSYNQALNSRMNAVDRYMELQERHPAFPAQETTGEEAAADSEQPADSGQNEAEAPADQPAN
ncbi:flagellar filament outer layer protein FlaA [Candidatus Haliotispira prima]|uniref:Flagellar filament outer layer protein FlaA n=1 Tax=Candidatus Haliotispira prima TaxID=3034016 RepID=A0ABY8MDP6_9SPIO|nr:flagellar filament outer layer protein FlaA [Candidatus Haliotispira prima]